MSLQERFAEKNLLDMSLVSSETEDAGRAIAQSAIQHSAALQNTETPILDYNNETELTAIVNLAYLSARDRYRIEREDKAGKGYVDFMADDGMILELKVDDTPEAAIQQIKERDYALKFQGKLAEKKRYTGRILMVGIGYSSKDKEHHCKIETFAFT